MDGILRPRRRNVLRSCMLVDPDVRNDLRKFRQNQAIPASDAKESAWNWTAPTV